MGHIAKLSELKGSVFSFIILRSSMDTKRYHTGGTSTTLRSSTLPALATHTFGGTNIKQKAMADDESDHGVHVQLDTVVHKDTSARNLSSYV